MPVFEKTLSYVLSEHKQYIVITVYWIY